VKHRLIHLISEIANGHTNQWTFGTSPMANGVLVASPDTGAMANTIHALMQQAGNLRMMSPGGNQASQPVSILGHTSSGCIHFY